MDSSTPVRGSTPAAAAAGAAAMVEPRTWVKEAAGCMAAGAVRAAPGRVRTSPSTTGVTPGCAGGTVTEMSWHWAFWPGAGTQGGCGVWHWLFCPGAGTQGGGGVWHWLFCPGAGTQGGGGGGVFGGITTLAVLHPVWAGLVRPIPWLRSHSYPALWSDPLGIWPCGFLLSALPTHPAQGFPTALPLPFPFPDGAPFLVEQ